MKSARSLFQSLIAISALSISFGLASTQTSAAYIVDHKIGEANLGNSGDAAELNALKAILDGLGIVSSGLTQDLKLDNMSAGFNVTADSLAGQWFIDVGLDQPGYFLLKFGTGGTAATADTFFFENIGELTKLVFTNAQVQNLSGGDCGANKSSACNIGKLSHYSTFNDANNPPPVGRVPEPASLFLIGAGLMGLSFMRRRKLARS
jgi:hypothetical protein